MKHLFRAGIVLAVSLVLALAINAVRPDGIKVHRPSADVLVRQAGIVPVNLDTLKLLLQDKRFLVLPLLSRVMRSIPAIGNDIAQPGGDEGAYDRTPLKGVVQLTKLWRTVQGDLGKVTAPVMLFRSRTDHVVDPSSAKIIIRDIGSHDVREVMLDRSYHVATLDYDAQEIFTGCAGFIASLVVA